MRRNILIVCCVLLSALERLPALAQGACSTLGQTPATAFPVCATDTFSQTIVPICTNKLIPVPGCAASTGNYADKNPYWYQFTCYQKGTLGFLITPNRMEDDYDWQLFDITGISNTGDVYTNPNLFISGNWSATPGLTGTSSRGTGSVQCASDPKDNVNPYSDMPVMQAGHVYLLMVSHFSDNQSGYKLSFGGGTAVIKDPKMPALLNVKSSCDATTIIVKLNKNIKCLSLAADGSDFILEPRGAGILSAVAAACNSGFDMDAVTLTLDHALPPGNYAVVVKKGTDGNTLLDDCDNPVPENSRLDFSIASLQPTLMDSIVPPACAPAQLQLVFKKNIRCSSISPDGSDFTITGPSGITVSAATGSCTADGLTPVITLKLASPIVRGGVYQLKLGNGTDGNTIIDECGQQTPAGAAISFSVKDTVSANFSYQLLLGCRSDTIVFAHNGNGGVNQWFWLLDAAGPSTLQNPVAAFTVFGNKQVFLKVSNGFCSDSIRRTIPLDNNLKASFETNLELCPEDPALFRNTSRGNNITDYNWDFGNGHTSHLQTPAPEYYPAAGSEKKYPVQLVVQNSLHCFDTANAAIKVLRSCYIAVPNAFTPNGDGQDDYLYPLNALKADNLEFNVYNRLGQLVFHAGSWTQKWDGRVNGNPQGAGTYVWTLRYTHHDTGKKVFLKGTSVLIR